MTSRSRALLLILSVCALGACGLIDEGSGTEGLSQAAPGTVKITDDWSCVADDNGTWDCTELNPEPAYVPTLPPVPDYDAESEAVAEEDAEVALGSQATAEPEPAGEVAAAVVVSSPDPQGGHDWQQISADGFVLQLAAHRSYSSAELTLASLDAPGAEVVQTRGSRGDLFVIIAGSYANRSAAKAAATVFQDRNSGADYWIRDAADFLQALY